MVSRFAATFLHLSAPLSSQCPIQKFQDVRKQVWQADNDASIRWMDQLTDWRTDGWKNRLRKPHYNLHSMNMTCYNPSLIRFPLFSAILALWGRTDGQTDWRTDGRTKPLIEMHLKKMPQMCGRAYDFRKSIAALGGSAAQCIMASWVGEMTLKSKATFLPFVRFG